MKSTSIAVLLLSLPACAFAVEKPDGILGIDEIWAGYSYNKYDYGYYGYGSDNLDVVGVGLGKNVIDNGKFGVDAGFCYSHAYGDGFMDWYDYEADTLSANATAFFKGTVSPYVSIGVSYSKVEIDYSYAYYEDENDDCWTTFGTVGLEIRIVHGLSGRVFVEEAHACSGETPSNQTIYGASLSYWFTDRIGFSIEESYSNYIHVDAWATSATLRYHF